MATAKVKILSVNTECPHCEHTQNVDSAEFDTNNFVAFTEYQTQCDHCGADYTFSLDVFK